MRMSTQQPPIARRHFLITSALVGTAGLIIPSVARAGTAAPPPSGAPALAPATTAGASETGVANAFLIDTAAAAAASGDGSIRPFRYRATSEDLADLKRRIAATRWPER